MSGLCALMGVFSGLAGIFLWFGAGQPMSGVLFIGLGAVWLAIAMAEDV